MPWGREGPFAGLASSHCQPSPQKAALAQFPELAPAQPELCLAGDQPPVLCPAQPAPEVLPAPSHGHHGEVLRAPQASLDVVSWWGGAPGWCPRGGHGLQLCAVPDAASQPGSRSLGQLWCARMEEKEGKNLEQKLALLCAGHPRVPELRADAWAPSAVCTQEGCGRLRGVRNAAAA